MKQILSAAPVDALLVVASPRRSPRAVIPGPAVNGIPAAAVFAAHPPELRPWIAAVRGARGSEVRPVLAEWDRPYLRLAARFRRRVRECFGSPAPSWTARDVDGAALCRRLGRGPALANYFGHGDASGLGGYHGIESREITRERGIGIGPMGVFCCWSCDTLTARNGTRPFGCHLIRRGAAAAFLGSTGPVGTRANAALVEIAGRSLLSVRPLTLADWIADVDQEVRELGTGEMKKAWAFYRIIGNPLQPLKTEHPKKTWQAFRE